MFPSFTFPPTVYYKGSLFSSLTICCLFFFYNGCPNSSEVISHCGFLKIFIYLFKLRWVLVAACEIFVVVYGIFIAACGLFSCGMWDL